MSIKGLVVNLSLLFLWLFQFMEGRKRLSRLFSDNLPAMFYLFSVLNSSFCKVKRRFVFSICRTLGILCFEMFGGKFSVFYNKTAFSRLFL